MESRDRRGVRGGAAGPGAGAGVAHAILPRPHGGVAPDAHAAPRGATAPQALPAGHGAGPRQRGRRHVCRRRGAAGPAGAGEAHSAAGIRSSQSQVRQPAKNHLLSFLNLKNFF
jgi:hypothetical protein